MHPLRRAAIFGILGLLVGAMLFGGAAWYYSGVLEDGAFALDTAPDRYDVIVSSITDDSVTLSSDSPGDWSRPGTWGLEWPGGYAQVGEILDQHDDRAARRLTLVEGIPEVGQRVRVDRFAYPGDPAVAFDLPFEDVQYDSAVGPLGAWIVGGPSDTWTIFVHGRATDRAEGLRLVPVFAERGLTTMLISYRNDDGFPRSAEEAYDYGATEWADLEAAVTYALANGAERVVLAGYSIGGSIVASFLYRSPEASRVAGVILDSPMLDFGATVDFQAADRQLPGPLTRFAKLVSQHRFDFSWDDLNYLDGVDRLEAPILLFHGTDDDTVPIETSERLLTLRPDLVTFVRVDGAGHARNWNAAPAHYEAAVRDFLDSIDV